MVHYSGVSAGTGYLGLDNYRGDESYTGKMSRDIGYGLSQDERRGGMLAKLNGYSGKQSYRSEVYDEPNREESGGGAGAFGGFVSASQAIKNFESFRN